MPGPARTRFICQGRFPESLVRFHVTVAEISWFQDLRIFVHDGDSGCFRKLPNFGPHEGILLHPQIHNFVRARVLCGTRCYQSASLDCSGVTHSIHVRKIEVDQDPAHAAHLTESRCWRRLVQYFRRLTAQMARRTCFKQQYHAATE